MLLEKPANRIQAYLLEKFAGYGVVTCTGLCLPYTPKGSTETAMFEYGVNGDRVTLDDRANVQFILAGQDGTYEELAQSRGRGTDYKRIGRIVLVMYTDNAEALELIEPALSQLSGIKMRRFDIKPQVVAGTFLRLNEDFKFTRPLIAFELEITERVLRAKCTELPTEVCVPVDIEMNGSIIKRVQSGGAYIIQPSRIVNQSGVHIASVWAGSSYPVFEFDTIQNSLFADSEIVNII